MRRLLRCLNTLILLAALVSAGAVARDLSERNWSVSSPGDQVEMQIRGTAEQGLEYRVLWHGDNREARVAVGWSPLGITTRHYNANTMQLEPLVSDFSANLSYARGKTLKGRQSYTMLTGKRRENEAAYNQRSLTFRHDNTRQTMRIDFRVFDHGVALRYAMPDTSGLHYQVIDERTGFSFGTDATHFGQPYDHVTIYNPSYETHYQQNPAGTALPPEQGTGWGFPSLFERRGIWVMLHESGLDNQFYGSHLAPQAPGGVYRVAPPLAEEAAGMGPTFATAAGPWTMPWRVMIVSDSLADIVESNLVFDLAGKSRIADPSWVRPGLASWSWWSDHESAKDPGQLKAFIRLAEEMNWRYSLVDANWNHAGNSIMSELVDYAEDRDVALFFWYNSGGPHNFIPMQPRNIMFDRMSRRKEFARISELGVKGVKIDFFQSDKQWMIDQYLDILEDAADFKLMVVFHGSTVPRGWARTWPNLMTMEAVRGGEFYTFSPESDYGENAPRQNTLLPFTRNVVGSMDYTPVALSHQQAERHTTDMHELALPVVFESGIQHIADHEDALDDLPGEFREYLGDLPAAWRDTRLLQGYPGKEVVLARQHGDHWYVAGINGEATAKHWILDLSRLTDRPAEAQLLFENAEGELLSQELVVPHGRSVVVDIQPHGGFVMIFK